jgi:hypothetical protein
MLQIIIILLDGIDLQTDSFPHFPIIYLIVMLSLDNATKSAPETAHDTFTGTTPDELPWDSSHQDDAFQKTILFFQTEIEELVTMGVEAFHHSEKAARELQALREELKGKQDELERVRGAEEKSRTTVAVRNCMHLCAFGDEITIDD